MPAEDARLREFLLEHYCLGDNQIQVTGNAGKFVALITWEPPRE
jgi:hypothetical protein